MQLRLRWPSTFLTVDFTCYFSFIWMHLSLLQLHLTSFKSFWHAPNVGQSKETRFTIERELIQFRIIVSPFAINFALTGISCLSNSILLSFTRFILLSNSDNLYSSWMIRSALRLGFSFFSKFRKIQFMQNSTKTENKIETTSLQCERKFWSLSYFVCTFVESTNNLNCFSMIYNLIKKWM